MSHRVSKTMGLFSIACGFYTVAVIILNYIPRVLTKSPTLIAISFSSHSIHQSCEISSNDQHRKDMPYFYNITQSSLLKISQKETKVIGLEFEYFAKYKRRINLLILLVSSSLEPISSHPSTH